VGDIGHSGNVFYGNLLFHHFALTVTQNLEKFKQIKNST
jgi:hypothetical protein